MTIDLDWDLEPYTQADRALRIACAIKNFALEAVNDSMPELSDDFPTKHQPIFSIHFDSEGWMAIRLQYYPHRMFTLTAFSQQEIDFIKAKHLEIEGKSLPEMEEILGSEWFDRNTFTYHGPFAENKVSYRDMGLRVLDWLNRRPLEKALEYNRVRVERAIPTPPSYNLEEIFGALWVLECENDIIQGTAFALEGVGLVTCEHCLGSATKAFRYNAPNQKFDVKILKRHAVVDLAVLELIQSPSLLKSGNPNDLKQLDHLLVAGHPNYGLGEPPIVSPGLVVGRRPRSGIQRILTNASIVSGSSGGPVLDASGKVIGVAVTGTRSFRTASQTEDHGIVPIDALELL